MTKKHNKHENVEQGSYQLKPKLRFSKLELKIRKQAAKFSMGMVPNVRACNIFMKKVEQPPDKEMKLLIKERTLLFNWFSTQCRHL
jgi:hypothetical protein